jgi:hypothetical protein
MTSSAPADYTVWVGGIPLEWTESAACERFATEVPCHTQDIRIVREYHTRASKGCCFVDFRTESEAMAFVRAWNHKTIVGRQLLINWERKGPHDRTVRRGLSGSGSGQRS